MGSGLIFSVFLGLVLTQGTLAEHSEAEWIEVGIEHHDFLQAGDPLSTYRDYLIRAESGRPLTVKVRSLDFSTSVDLIQNR